MRTLQAGGSGPAHSIVGRMVSPAELMIGMAEAGAPDRRVAPGRPPASTPHVRAAIAGGPRASAATAESDPTYRAGVT